ncbi:hypothetical protein [Vitiosangium sp. GDMCC 1.1324]|uniref:hypothetical protein n=1 Tax=Vitiosangium sp. (strain GDMCC 1.1324) TaxID=2138576 RepID=UPI000D340A4E|nr:hypothetical protein [Vitiosangium sp. GDMCC 1.1324]PTL77423.1 hypothetical protein DAT35_44260 [Vitiosangium sp. GDMCC 1.1324]
MRLFLPQTQLEEWALEDKADVKDGVLVVTGEEGVYPVTPAVHIVQLVTGEDANGLVSKVKTEDQLKTLGAEQMADSVLLGDTAYEVVPGYLAEVPVSPSDAASAEGKPGSETDLLAAFLLNKMG